MGSIDLFDTMWIYEAASQVLEYQSVAQKQTEILLDTPVIPRWVCSPSEGTTAKKENMVTVSSSGILAVFFYP